MSDPVKIRRIPVDRPFSKDYKGKTPEEDFNPETDIDLADEINAALEQLSRAPGGGGAGAGLRAASLAALLTLGGAVADGERVSLESVHAGLGQGGGELVWRANSTAAPDGGGVFAPNPGQPGRFIRTAHALGSYAPEHFGARGDGTSDDYPAWRALTKAVSAKGGGTVTARPGANYYYAQYVDWERTDGGLTDAWADTPAFWGCKSVTVDLQGATITQYRGGYRRQRAYMFDENSQGHQKWDSAVEPLSGLTFAYCQHFILRNANLDGSGRTWTRWGIAPTGYTPEGYPIGGASLNEPYSQGVNIWSCDNYTLINVHSFDNLTDGYFIGYSEVYGPQGAPQRLTNETRLLSKKGVMLSCSARQNRRQGVSLIGNHAFTALASDFSYTGVTALNPDGTYQTDAYGWHTPGCGVDIEPSTHPDYEADPNWRVLERTGTISFVGCTMEHNQGGGTMALYSAKIYGDIVYQGCTIDSSGAHWPDAWEGAAPGVTYRDCTIRLPKNGFLWQDHEDRWRNPERLGCTVDNCRIFIKRELGYINANRPQPLRVTGNQIFFPASKGADDLGIFFLDRGPNGAKNIGGLKAVRFEGNHIKIPYTYLSDPQNGDAVGMFEGVGTVSGNVWELTGTKPLSAGPYATWQVIHYTDLGGGQTVHATHPLNEQFVGPGGVDGAPNDFLVSTPNGWVQLTHYTADVHKGGGGGNFSGIPVGLAGENPPGEYDIAIGRVGKDTTLTGVVGGWDVSLPDGMGATLRFWVNDTEQSQTAEWQSGGSGDLPTLRHFPLVVPAYSSLRVQLTVWSTGGQPHNPAHFAAVLLGQELPGPPAPVNPTNNHEVH